MTKELKISISGDRQIGKTNIAMIIYNVLKALSYTVEYKSYNKYQSKEIVKNYQTRIGEYTSMGTPYDKYSKRIIIEDFSDIIPKD